MRCAFMNAAASPSRNFSIHWPHQIPRHQPRRQFGSTATEDRIRVGVCVVDDTIWIELTQPGCSRGQAIAPGETSRCFRKRIRPLAIGRGLAPRIKNSTGLCPASGAEHSLGTAPVADDTSTLRICRLESLEVLHTITAAHSKVIRDLREPIGAAVDQQRRRSVRANLE